MERSLTRYLSICIDAYDRRDTLVSLQFVDQELQKLNAQAAVLQTARMAYAEALKEALPKKGLSFN